MDPKSQKAVEKEVENHPPDESDIGDRRGHTVPVLEVVSQPQPQQKSPLGKIRKYGAVDFNGRKEDDSSTA